MLREALEQTGIPKLIGWQEDEINEDGIVRKAVVSNHDHQYTLVSDSLRPLRCTLSNSQPRRQQSKHI